jgi:hypothetical protein
LAWKNPIALNILLNTNQQSNPKRLDPACNALFLKHKKTSLMDKKVYAGAKNFIIKNTKLACTQLGLIMIGISIIHSNF